MDYAALLQAAIALYGEEKARQLNEKQLALLERQLNDVRDVELPTFESLKAEELGDSAVAGMQSDQSLRSKQLNALGELQHIIDSGGLDLSDKVGLEEALDAYRNETHRARAGVSGDLESRGQLDGGARMVMGLDAATRGANDLRKTGMETAAMAQRRRLNAIRDASNLAGGLREQDWRESESANRAKDMRDERNAAAREKAGYYNAGLPQQQFTNAMAKATGQQPSTNAMAQGVGAAAGDERASAAGLAGVVGAAGNPPAYGGSSGTYQYSTDSNDYAKRGGAQDISDEDDK